MCSYADDTQLTISIGDRHEDTRAKLNNCLTEMATWMSNHCLKLNAEKSEILLLGGANHIWEASWWPHSLGVAPAPKQCAKNLGVLIDNTLSTRDHVRTLCGKSFATLKLLKRLFPWIPLESRWTVTQALLISRLDYGNALLVGMPDYLFKCLQVVQNAEAKLVCNKDRYSSATECLRQLHWLPMRQRARFKLLGHTHRALHHTGPRILQNKIKFYTPPRCLWSYQQVLAETKRIRKARAGGRTFSYLTVLHWNKLPLELWLIKDYTAFRKKQKTHLFPKD